MTNQVPKADGLNYAEIRGNFANANLGGRPGIRKRSYHRALKSGKIWALMQKSGFELMNRISREMFGYDKET